MNKSLFFGLCICLLIGVGSVYAVDNNATGGTKTTIIQNGLNYTVHTFTSNGTFTINSASLTVEALVVAGGGGGGGSSPRGGGGGAGGLLYNSELNLSSQSYNVIVGNGGAGNTNGQASNFSTLNAVGGGSGGWAIPSTSVNNYGRNGGSGGGGANGWGSGVGGNGTAGQGNNGGFGYEGGGYYAGCGGGAGSAATNSTSTTWSTSGSGLNYSINGSNVYYAGGGGGSRLSGTAANVTLGGSGVGGNGGIVDGCVPPTNATPNTGSGGGGGGQGTCTYAGGLGANGIVIIRYLTTSVTTINLSILSPLNNTYSKSNTIFLTGNITSITGVWNVSAIFNGTNVGSAYINYNYTNTTLVNNITFYYKLDGNINNEITSTYYTSNTGSYVAGKYNNATNLSAGTKLILNISKVNPGQNTLSFWVKRNQAIQHGKSIMNFYGNGGSGSGGFGIDEFNAADPCYDCWYMDFRATTSETIANFNVTKYIPVGTWVHFLMTINNSYVGIYINGTLVNNKTLTRGYAPPLNPMVFGDNSGYAAYDSPGFVLDEVAYYTVVLNQSQITELYNSQQYPFSVANAITANISTTGTFNITTSALSWNVEYPWYFQAKDLSSNTTVNTTTQYLVTFNSTPTAAASCVVNLGNAYFIPNGCTSTY